MPKIHKIEENFYAFECPACGENHWFQISPRIPAWTWNNDFENPTVFPSIRVGGTVPITDDEHARILKGELIKPKPFCCHFFIKEGKIEFCADSTHEFAGKAVAMIDWEI